MLKQQVVSVTDLRTKTKASLTGLKNGPKFVFSNNSPVAVLMDVDEYESLIRPDLYELSMDEVTDDMLKKAEDVKNIPNEEFVDL